MDNLGQIEAHIETLEGEDLQAFALEHGVKLPRNIKDENARERILGFLQEHGDIERPKKKVPVAPVDQVQYLKDIPEERKRTIMIHEASGSANRPVPVSVNGRTFLLQRGMKVKVPDFVLHVLENAVEKQFQTIQDTEGNRKMVSREVPAYPYTFYPNE